MAPTWIPAAKQTNGEEDEVAVNEGVFPPPHSFRFGEPCMLHFFELRRRRKQESGCNRQDVAPKLWVIVVLVICSFVAHPICGGRVKSTMA